MIVHVFEDTPHHYFGMCDFLKKCEVIAEQKFLVKASQSAGTQAKLNEIGIAQYTSPADLVAILSSYPKNTQFVLHGIFDPNAWLALLKTALIKRCSYVFWGAEVYRHNKKSRTVKERLVQVLHILCCYRFNNVLSLNSGDAALITKLLKRRYVEVLPYPLIGVDESILLPRENSPRPFKILVGNSAAASNRHEFALSQLAHLKDENIEIIVPLNYAGQQDYIDEVIARGKQLFGDKFRPITKMLAKEEYNQLLNAMDMTVFAQLRQQGLYVVYAMFLMQKPMFMLDDTTSFESLSSLGFTLGKTTELKQLSLADIKQFSPAALSENKKLMQSTFTENALAPKWASFINGLNRVRD